MPGGACFSRTLIHKLLKTMLKAKQEARIQPLDALLDGTEQANKKDTWDYTAGHLNHNHLFKPLVLEEKSFWKSGKIPAQHNKKIKKMKDPFINAPPKTNFINRDLVVKSSCAGSPVVKQSGPYTPINTPFASSILDTQSQTACLENPEQNDSRGSPPKNKELKLPELKVLTFEGPQTSQDQRKQYRFLPAYFTGLTKADQFSMFLQFDREILQRKDISKDFYKNMTVESDEKKLTKELMNIAHIRPPHFARLQIFSETFKKICKDSSMFGSILKEIKTAYDVYVNDLLDAQSSSQHEILMCEIAGMKKRPVKTEDVEEVTQNLRGLEHKALIALERNDQLRSNLKTELRTAVTSETVSDKVPWLQSRESDPTSEQCLTSETEVFVAKRREVLKTLMEVNTLEEDIKKNLTHALNTEATEQYIKDIQTETVKLKSSNDFLQRANKDLDSEIKRVLMKQKLTIEKQDLDVHV
ncbi:uncharacterized protein C6orf118 homolog isoform X2 [Ranitomeya variabilis]|uniref:uncharacterized protein C6orf118 homolog isoform X2 n=1 Tax=Ranitomeya variabilis TaxID=490064 RepID=UPI0040573BEC